MAAVVDFLAGLITKEEAVAVIVLYLTGSQGQQAAGIPASEGMTKGAAEASANKASGAADEPGADGVLSNYIEQRNGPGPVKDRD